MFKWQFFQKKYHIVFHNQPPLSIFVLAAHFILSFGDMSPFANGCIFFNIGPTTVEVMMVQSCTS